MPRIFSRQCSHTDTNTVDIMPHSFLVNALTPRQTLETQYHTALSPMLSHWQCSHTETNTRYIMPRIFSRQCSHTTEINTGDTMPHSFFGNAHTLRQTLQTQCHRHNFLVNALTLRQTLETNKPPLPFPSKLYPMPQPGRSGRSGVPAC